MKQKSPVFVPLAIVALISVASMLFFYSFGARQPDGTPVLALDDSYIHLQYAWETSQGHFLQYHAGEAPSTGATSLLYMALLSLAFMLGAGHDGVITVLLAVGGVMFLVSAALMADITRRVIETTETEKNVVPSPAAGLLGGLLFAGSGWMAWAYLSGMETGLLIVLVLCTMWARLTHRPGLTAGFVALAALTRPEAVILAVVVFAVDVFAVRRHSTRRSGTLLWWLLPLIAALVGPAINVALTGSPGSTGFQAKSLFTLVPFSPVHVAQLMLGNVVEIVAGLFGGMGQGGHWHVFPLTQVLTGAGLIILWQRDNRELRQFVVVCLGWTIVGIAATASLQTATWHHYRYQMPFYPALIAPVCAALMWLIEMTARRLNRLPVAVLRIGLALVVGVWSVYSVVDFAGQYALDTQTIASMQSVLARWIRDNVRPDAVIAAHDVGVLGYLYNQPTIDVVGLTTSGMAQPFRNGPGSEYEALESTQPEYYMIYPDVAPPFFGQVATQGLIGAELTRVSLERFSPYVSAGNSQIVSKPDWSNVQLPRTPHQPDILTGLDGWELVDSLDIADLTSETQHDYQWWNNGDVTGFPSDARQLNYRVDPSIVLADGGRLLTGGERFTLKTRPGQALMLVARLHQTADMSLRASVNGVDVGQWRLPAIPGEWLESAFNIPAAKITTTRTRIELSVEEIIRGTADTRYSPFYYWAYQSEAAPPLTPAPQIPSKASFGEAVRLLGYDLSSDHASPGETLELAFHWQAMTSPPLELRVFVHLVDPAKPDTAEGIVAQVDHTPMGGTRPFWVWNQSEIGIDRYSLAIPPTVGPGRYLVLLGIYDPATGQRMLILNAPDFGSNRLLIATFTIE